MPNLGISTYQQQPIVITQGWTQFSDGSTVQYLSLLEGEIHENLLQQITHSNVNSLKWRHYSSKSLNAII